MDRLISKYLSICLVLLAFSIVIAVPLYHGITHYLFDNADPDVDLTYMALVFNSGRAVPFNNFTAYGYVLMYGPWLSLIHAFGLIEFSTIDPLIDTTRFEALYSQAISAGRVLSIVLAVLTTAVFWLILRLAFKSEIIAALGTLLLASSLGLAYQYLLMRPELPAMFFILCCAASLVFAARSSGWPFVATLFLAGFTGIFAAIVKVQAVLVLLPLAPLPFLFAPETAPENKPANRKVIIGFIVCALACSIPAILRIADMLAISKTWSYQILCGLYLTGLFIAYAKFRIRSADWAAASLASLILGTATSLYLILIRDHWWTPYAIVNFVDFMSFDMAESVEAGSRGLVALMTRMPGYFWDHFRDMFLINRLSSKDYWMQIIYWSSAVLFLVCLRKNRRLSALQTIYFLAFAIGLATTFATRGYHFYYQIFVEPWVLLAAAAGAVALLKTTSRKNLVMGCMVAVVLAVTFVNVRYRAIAPSTAKTRNLTHVCCYVNYAALISKHLRPYCEKGLREIGEANRAYCYHDQFPNRMKYYLHKQSTR